jgi:hypothetical protein
MDAEGRKKGKDTPTDDKEEGLLENVGAGLGMGAASVALRQRQKDDEVEREDEWGVELLIESQVQKRRRHLNLIKEQVKSLKSAERRL